MKKSNSLRALHIMFLIPVLILVVLLAVIFAQRAYVNAKVNEARTVVDMVENIGLWASQYKGVWVRKEAADKMRVGDFLSRESLSPAPSGTAAAVAYHQKNPALIQREISQITDASAAKAKFRMTSDTFINPENAPNRFEANALAYIRDSRPAKAEYFEVKSNELLYARRIVADRACMKCHESAAKAPEVIRTKYPRMSANGYAEGQIIGLTSVRLPIDSVEGMISKSVDGGEWLAVAILVLLFWHGLYLFKATVIDAIGTIAGVSRMMRGFVALNLVQIAGLVFFFQHWQRFILVTNILNIMLAAAGLLVCWYYGKRRTHFSLLALALLGCATAVMTRTYGVELPEYWMQVGFATVVFVLSLGLTDRLHQLKHDEELEQKSLVLRLEQSERVLEKRVAERTLELENLSRIDGLTQVYNRRYFLELAEEEWRRARRDGRSFVMLMMDVDHFKGINDRYGHLGGDSVLVLIAKLCQESMRKTDLVGRFGGEEFLILRPETTAAEGVIFADRLRSKLASHALLFEGAEIRVTVSIGGAENTDDYANLTALIAAADEAMYAAKHRGRNQCVFAMENETS